jgi:hypothetical protein
MRRDIPENPVARAGGPEVPLEGWPAIAGFIGESEDTAQRRARLRTDRLPVWKYFGTVLAWPSALREWKARHILPLHVADDVEESGV